MESLIDFEIIGEVFIPIETEKDKLQQITLLNLIQLNYSDFRKVFFQGELTKMYIVIRFEKKNIVNIKEIFDSLYVKIEFESFGASSDINVEENYDKTLTDLFSINSSKISTSNHNYDTISNKTHYEQDNTAIFEVFKHIIVPENLLDVDLLMKVDLMIKNENNFAQNINPLEYFKNGYFKTIQNYRKIKTLFKETKIIRPLNIKDVKQTDVLLDTSLLQAKLENTTSGINFVDESLKASRFLIKETNTSTSSILNTGMSININEIEILKEETTFDEQSTQHVKHIRDLYIKNDKVSLSNINFSLFNRDLPLILSAGEELYLTIKVVKSAFLSEKSEKENVLIINEKESILQDNISQKGSILLTSPNVSSQYQSNNTFWPFNISATQVQSNNRESLISNRKSITIFNTQTKNESESVSKMETYSK